VIDERTEQKCHPDDHVRFESDNVWLTEWLT